MDKNFLKLSDVAIGRPTSPSLEIPLEQVGMENIQTRIQVLDPSGHVNSVAASVDVQVSLDQPGHRGIHMSRLYKIVNELDQQPLTREYVLSRLEQMLSTHKDLSRNAYLTIHFSHLMKRPALLSGQEGWRAYPVRVQAQSLKGQTQYAVEVRVLYSSTCPCSASLSRQALQDQFSKDFADKKLNLDDFHQWLGKESSVAVPHSQRSEATVNFVFAPFTKPLEFGALLDLIENALGTPVQAAVKREDEQEFARRNGENQMFCEDAARRLKATLLSITELADFHIQVRHFESLHAHDVVARCSKNQ